MYIGQRSFDGLTIARKTPITYLVSADYSILPMYYGFVDDHYLSLEKQTQHRRAWSNQTISQLAKLAGSELLDRMDVILPYASFSQDNHNKYAMIKPELKSLLDDKVFMKKIFQKSGVKFPKKINISKALTTGKKYISKGIVGSAGSGITNYQGKILDEGNYVEEYIYGVPLCVNVIISTEKIKVFTPSVQVIGISDLTNKQYGYCGNDFQHPILRSALLQQQINSACTKISNILQTMGYLGAVGIDFILSKEGELYALEINPRFQNSSQILDFSLEKKCNFAPDHLASYFGENENSPSQIMSSNYAIEYSQLIIHSKFEYKTTKIIPEGVYTFSKSDELNFNRITNLNNLADDELCVVGVPSIKGMLVDADSVIAKVITPSRVLNDSGNKLTTKMDKLIQKVKEAIS